MSATPSWTHEDLARACAANKNGTVIPHGDSFKTNCLVHPDKVQSLNVSRGRDGNIVVHCMAGCSQEVVWKACCDLMGGEPARSKSPRPPINTATRAILPAPQELDVANIQHRDLGTPALVYDYRDQDGKLHFYNCRFEFVEGTSKHEKFGRKTHRPYTCVSNPASVTQQYKWRFQAPEKGKRIPYRLNHLKPDGVVLIHEGEKAANGGAQLSPEISHLGWWGGAANVLHTDWTSISGRIVWLLPDADDPGVEAMDKLRDALQALNCTITYCRDVKQAMRTMGVTPENNVGFDAADAVQLGWTHDQFTQFLNVAAHKADDGADSVPSDAASNVVDTLRQSIKEAQDQKAIAAFLPLGYNKDTYYYLSRATKQIHVLSPQSHKKANLLSICPHESFWNTYVPHTNKGPDYEAAMMRMMSECHKAGVFDADNIRGRGAWFDGGKIIIHLGDRLVVDGEEQDVMSRPGRHIYELANRLAGPGKKAMPDKECAHLYETCQMFSWENPLSADYLIGWIALAPICGAVKWRPHVWLTGPQSAGKTTIENRFVGALLGNMKQSVQGNSTEAGIRQTLKHDALPVLIDEAEQENDNTRQRGEAIIQMIRQASSDTDAKTLKGGMAGQSSSYHIRSMFLLGSIATSLRRAADQARITKLALYPNSEKWSEIKTRLDNITPEVSKRLICRVVQLIPVIRDNADLLADRIRDVTGSQRIGDQYGAFLAGSEAMKHTRRLTLDEADALVEVHRGNLEDHQSNIEKDEQRCLEHLMQSVIRVERASGAAQNMAISELVEVMCRGSEQVKFPEADSALQRHGLRVDQIAYVLRVANTHSQLGKLFQHTPWAIGWTQFLKRLPRVTASVSSTGRETKIRFAGGAPQRAIQIPLDLVIGDDPDVTDEMPF